MVLSMVFLRLFFVRIAPLVNCRRMSALSADCPQAVCGQMGCRFESFLWLVTARTRSARCWLELRNLCKPWSNSAVNIRLTPCGERIKAQRRGLAGSAGAADRSRFP